MSVWDDLQELDEIAGESIGGVLSVAIARGRELESEVLRLREENSETLLEALAAMSQFMCTPEKGYRGEPHMLAVDIRRLGSERDALREQALAATGENMRLRWAVQTMVHNQTSVKEACATLCPHTGCIGLRALSLPPSEGTALLTRAIEALRAVSMHGPLDNGIKEDGIACGFCDMGGAGYASRGDGFHDDECAVSAAQRLLADWDAWTKGSK